MGEAGCAVVIGACRWDLVVDRNPFLEGKLAGGNYEPVRALVESGPGTDLCAR